MLAGSTFRLAVTPPLFEVQLGGIDRPFPSGLGFSIVEEELWHKENLD